MERLKCCAGEGWRSVGLIMWEMRKYYKNKGIQERPLNIKNRKLAYWSDIAYEQPFKTHY